jgi:NIPSNAP protein
MGGGTGVITLSIRYTIDARKRSDFERYARALGSIIPRCGRDLVGYWLPTKYAGPTNTALALIDFPSLAAYEQYRERLAKDPDNLASIARADESGCILIEDRAFLERG